MKEEDKTIENKIDEKFFELDFNTALYMFEGAAYEIAVAKAIKNMKESKED